MNEFADFREGFDQGEVALHFGAANAHNFAVDEDILATGEFGIEAGAQFEKCSDTATRNDAARSGLKDSGDDLEERAFAAAVRANEADDFTLSTVNEMSRSAQKSVWRARGGKDSVRECDRRASCRGGTASKRSERAATNQFNGLSWDVLSRKAAVLGGTGVLIAGWSALLSGQGGAAYARVRLPDRTRLPA